MTENIVLDSLSVNDHHVILSYHINDMLDDKSIASLKRGAVSEVTHHIQLWKARGFMDKVVDEQYGAVKVFYDNWEQKFRIITEDEDRLTPHIETVRKKCCRVSDLTLSRRSTLEAHSKYYVTIQIAFQPISADTYETLRDVLKTSDDKETKETNKRSGGIWNTMLDIFGLGDKKFSFKSGDYIFENGTLSKVK